MIRYDVFNGDADGLCSLQQLRLAMPADTVLVTGVKRDVALLARVPASAGDAVTVLDISADVNHDALVTLLDRGATVDYFDHHHAGTLPRHPGLRAHVDTSAQVCTGLIVDRYLDGRQRAWAVVAAYGDSLPGPARAAAATLRLRDDETCRLQHLGELLAYNAYGDTEADLIVHPAALYRALAPYADPLAFIAGSVVCRTLGEQRSADRSAAATQQPEFASRVAAVYVLPDEAWSRRIRGTLANDAARRDPDRAHAVLSPNAAGGFTVSVRAPVSRPSGADALCRQFPTGNGRVGAAGINHLPTGDVARFIRAMHAAFAGTRS